MNKILKLFKGNQLVSKPFDTVNLTVLSLALGLLAIAVVDKDYRQIYSTLATSAITAQLVKRGDSKSNSGF